MQRRKFIKDSLSGLPILLLVPSILTNACKDDELAAPNGKKVIVVGAGMAGLAAAKKLLQKGFSVVILESQEKIGGRLRTDRSTGIAFDEGAYWIHGVKGNPLTTLAQQAGTQTILADDTSLLSYDLGGNLRNTTDYSKIEEQFYTVLETMMKKGNPNQSFETVFKNLYPQYANDRLWKFFLSTYLTFDTGDLDKLSSTLYYEGEDYDDKELIIANGYDTIPNLLAQGIDIQLNARVSKIDYQNEKVKIWHGNTYSEADFVLVTVPLGVLKKNAIEFNPKLPAAKQTAIEKIGMSCVNKFLLVWNSAFWDDVQYITYTPESTDRFTYFLNIKKLNPNANALMTFAYSEYGRKTETMSDNQLIDEIMANLKDIYGNSIPQPSKFLRTKWQSNENTFGAYSYTAVGTEMRHFDDLAKEVNDRLFFAGEHTESEYFSTAHGAYLSGLREADKIIDLV